MVRPKYVYHGGGRKLEGDKLVPKRAKDLAGDPDNNLTGVYASSDINEAIAMGITSCKGVSGSAVGFRSGELEAVIYNGWPKQKYFYLYHLPSENFEEKPRGSRQYVSKVSVRPIKIEKLLVKDYIHLVRKASDKERMEWNNKYKVKNKKE